MKRFFTFALLACMAMAGFANPQQANASLTKGQAKKMLLQREALNMNLAANKIAQQQDNRAVTEQKNELDTVELVFKSFYEDPYYIPTDTVISRNFDTIVVGGDWLITLKNEIYQFNFDFYGGSPESPEGTYTVDNFDLPYCWCVIPAAPNNSSYPQTCDLTIKKEQLSNNTYLYILDAVMVTTFGIGGEVNGAFKIHAEHKVVTASQRYDVAILDCVVTPEEDRFSIAGKNDTMDVDLTFFSDLGVIGYYSQNLLDTENSKLVHRGTSYEVMELEGMVVTSELKTGGMAYVAMMEILAESENDTTFFNIAMEAPIIPTDTVSVYCTNLMMSVSMDAVVIDASNTEYEIYAGYNDVMIRDSANYVGTSTSGNAMVYITELETEKLIGALTTNLSVVGSKAKGYTVTGQVLGDDHKFYQLYLTNVLPDDMDTVNVDFPLNSKAMFDIDELGLEELLIANYNGDYSISLDILNINQILGGEFTRDDLFIDETEVTSYFVKHTADEDILVDLVRVDGEIIQKNDTTFLTATIIGFDATVYNISMYYTIPTPTETCTYTFTEDYTTFTNALPQGIFILQGMTEDGSAMANVQVNRNYTGTAEGTYICDGEFIENQFEPFETYVATFNPETNEYVPHYMQKGEMTVTLDENNKIVAKASFICDDAKQYELTFYAAYERAHLPYDAEEGDVEVTYTADAYIQTDDYVATDNILFFEIFAADLTSMVSLAFYIDHLDEEIIIPEGVYPIQPGTSPVTLGTVHASPGLAVGGGPIQSYFSELDNFDGELYYVDGRGYFLVDGTVTVENVDGKLKLDVDAVNSYDLSVKLHYDASLTAVEDIEDSKPAAGAEKRIQNGHLFIKRNGAIYNATGARVK